MLCQFHPWGDAGCEFVDESDLVYSGVVTQVVILQHHHIIKYVVLFPACAASSPLTSFDCLPDAYQ